MSNVSLDLKTLAMKYPIMFLGQINLGDESKFSALDWQKKSFKLICENFLESPKVMQDMIGLSRYTSIPICNIGQDRLNYATDVIFSRLLKRANCLSWYSETRNPDLGRVQSDDARKYQQFDMTPDEYINKGLNPSHCVEIDIGLLAFNTIVVSEELKNIDKEASKLVDAGDNDGEVLDVLDERVLARNAFRYVRLMLQSWCTDVLHSSNPYADQLIQNIHRWFSKQESNLYDPLLYRMMSSLMKKIFGYLLNTFKNLSKSSLISLCSS